MLIHSIVAKEWLLPSLPESQRELLQLPMGPNWIEGTENNGHLVIQRLISTNPAAYLNPKWAPGQIISKK